MPKSNVIILRPNMTFTERKTKVKETKLLLSKDIQPEFSPGKSVFIETEVSRFKFWKAPRRLIIVGEGALQAFEFASNPGEIVPHWWTLEDAKKFVAQMIAKTKGQQKPISNWQFLGLMVGIGIIVILQIMAMRGGRI